MKRKGMEPKKDMDQETLKEKKLSRKPDELQDEELNKLSGGEGNEHGKYHQPLKPYFLNPGRTKAKPMPFVLLTVRDVEASSFELSPPRNPHNIRKER